MMRSRFCCAAFLLLVIVAASLHDTGRAAPPPADCPALPPHVSAPTANPILPTPTSVPVVEPHMSGAPHPFLLKADISDGAPLVQQAKLLASDNISNPCHTGGGQGFGREVAISGDGRTAVVIGASRGDLVAYVFVRDGAGWREQAKLIDPTATRASFETAPAINRDGSMIAIAARVHRGVVFIFARHGERWDVEATLEASDGAETDAFGASVAMSADGGVMLVGAVGREKASGAAYLFTQSDAAWVQRAILIGQDRRPFAGFGRAVALSGNGDTAVVGTVGFANLTGSISVFVRNGTAWTEQAVVTPDDFTLNERFGDAVAISADGSVIVVGAPNRSGTATGGAYILAANGAGWSQQVLTDRVLGVNEFGIAVAISADGRAVFIGAREENVRIGAVYLYQQIENTWAAPIHLTATDGESGDDFGIAVAADGDGTTLAVGSPYAHDLTGAVYIFGPPTT